MVSNKKRLYIALYPSGVVNNEERRYHWGFLVGPKDEKSEEVPGARYHVRNMPVRAPPASSPAIVIAKITDEQRLVEILRNSPVVQHDPNWRCRTWVAQALRAIEQDGKCVGSAVLDWETIEATAREYTATKAGQGRFDTGDMLMPKPTWDMLENREVVP